MSRLSRFSISAFQHPGLRTHIQGTYNLGKNTHAMLRSMVMRLYNTLTGLGFGSGSVSRTPISNPQTVPLNYPPTGKEIVPRPTGQRSRDSEELDEIRCHQIAGNRKLYPQRAPLAQENAPTSLFTVSISSTSVHRYEDNKHAGGSVSAYFAPAVPPCTRAVPVLWRRND